MTTTTAEGAGELTAAELTTYVRATAADENFVKDCIAQASALVSVRAAGGTVPAEIVKLATREVAADLFNRRGVRNGVATFDGADLAPVRVTRDPMKAADDILRPYVGLGVA